MADNEIVDFKYDSSKSFLDSVNVLRRSLRSDRSRPDLYLRFKNVGETQTLSLHVRRDDFYVCKFRVGSGRIWYLEDGNPKDHLGIGLDYAKLAQGIGAVTVGLVRFGYAIDEIIRSFSSDGSERRNPFHKDLVGKALASLIVMAIETSRDEWFSSEMYQLFISDEDQTRKLVPAEKLLVNGWGKASTSSLQGLTNNGLIFKSSPLEDEDIAKVWNDARYARDAVSICRTWELNLRAHPLVIAAYPYEVDQFALGLGVGGVYVIEPLESEGKWGNPPPLEISLDANTNIIMNI